MITKSHYIFGGKNMLITLRRKPLLYLIQIQVVSNLIFGEVNQKGNHGLDIEFGTDFQFILGLSFISCIGTFFG
jgi:hypothetical protein